MEIDSPTTIIKNTPSLLRSMRFGELLDTTFSLYRTHFLRFLSISVVYFITILIGGSISLFNGTIARNEWLAIWLPTLIVIFCITVVVVNALMSATAQAYLDGKIKTGEVLKRGVHRFFACFVGVLLYGLLAILTVILIMIPFGLFFDTFPTNAALQIIFGLIITFISLCIVVYFVTYWCFFAAAILVEGKSVRDAIKRRRELVRRMSWQIVGIMIAIFLLYLGISFILRLSFSLLLALTGLINMAELSRKLGSLMFIQYPIIRDELSLLNIVLYLIHLSVDTITIPIWVIGATLLYFDQRIRKEGFDIEMMVERQGA